MTGKKKVFIVIGALVLLGASCSIGNSTASGMIDGQKVTYSQLTQQIGDKKAELNAIIGQYNEAKKIVEERDKAVKDLAAVQTAHHGLEGKLSALDSQIKDKQGELEKVSNAVVVKKQAPKQLPAGHFTVGKDIEAGRYKVTGDSNFVVYDASGSLKVNTILGGSGVSEYVVELADGETIQAEGHDKYQPVQ